jgi:hypothetical protein
MRAANGVMYSKRITAKTYSLGQTFQALLEAGKANALPEVPRRLAGAAVKAAGVCGREGKSLDRRSGRSRRRVAKGRAGACTQCAKGFGRDALIVGEYFKGKNCLSSAKMM